jgi:aminodeoxyfutalosine deaminase
MSQRSRCDVSQLLQATALSHPELPVLVTPVDGLIADLPKVELHIHLEGSIAPRTLLSLARKNGVADIPRSEAELAEWYTPRNFSQFVRVYTSALCTLRDEEDFASLAEEVAHTLAAQNVRYAEVILTPYAHMLRGVASEDLFAGIERGRLKAERECGIVLRWIPDFDGGLGSEAGEVTLDTILASNVRSVVGFGVGGIEVERQQFGRVFARAREAGLRSIPHAGETGGPDNVWSAIRTLNADRIGHGIGAMSDSRLVAYLREVQLPLDVCPSSNVCTGVVPGLDGHPLLRMLNDGLLVTLNSDDPPMFATNIFREYQIAYRLGAKARDLVQLARNGVHASFLDGPTKEELLSEIDTVETAWSLG